MTTPGQARLRALRQAKDAMDRDWADPGLDLAAVAAHAGCSRYHFVRAFRAAYGETPGRNLSRRRIERAGELLRSANLTVTEICLLVGFSSLGTFSARFKEQTGISPSEYRSRHVGSAAERRLRQRGRRLTARGRGTPVGGVTGSVGADSGSHSTATAPVPPSSGRPGSPGSTLRKVSRAPSTLA